MWWNCVRSWTRPLQRVRWSSSAPGQSCNCSSRCTLLTIAEGAEHIAGAFAVVMHDLTTERLRVEDMSLLVGVLEVGDVLLEVVVVLGRNGCCWSSLAGGARAVGTARHSALKARGDTKSLLAETLGLAHGLSPPHTGDTVVVAVDVDGDVDFDEARVFLDAQLRGLALGGLGEGLVWRAVQVLQHVQLLLGHLGGDVDIVLGHDRVVVFNVHDR